ncbi:methyltransferase domain-containing protein [Streptomyces sp. Ac-502]|uniref:methyltransferase domain-containing protein n=1 Tax=Streptomyces sp. Ac-502 TaxID=3342801 RepID=UPI00220872E2|nr:methyltransferase [Streptomyces tumemacerans]
MADLWELECYLATGEQRRQTFADLVSRIRAPAPETVADLGCGPGDCTVYLRECWPFARITGVDQSPRMLAAAGRHAVPGKLGFQLADVCDWRPAEPLDVLVSSAALQCVARHTELFERYLGLLKPAGWFAFQVPADSGVPRQSLLSELCAAPRWRERIGPLVYPTKWVADPEEYRRVLLGLGCRVTVWETVYRHVLPGADAVLRWMRGIGLPRELARLPAGELREFLAQYAGLLRQAYPRQEFGTVLPYRSLFVVAQKPG